MSFVWINGQLIDRADAKVSPFDHGFLYGDGVWEPFRVFNGRPFRLDRHLDHLDRSAERWGLDIPLAREELTAAIETTIRANNRREGYGRIIISRGPGTLGPDTRKIDSQLIIIAEEYYPFPLELYPHGLNTVTFRVPRHDVRLLGQPHLIEAKRSALEQGCLETILVNPAGNLTGTSEGMLFLIRDGAVVVAGDHIPDATGYEIAAVAGELGLIVVEHTIQLADLTTATGAFIAGTSCGVIAIVRVDEQVIGGGVESAITRRLRDHYLAVTRGNE